MVLQLQIAGGGAEVSADAAIWVGAVLAEGVDVLPQAKIGKMMSNAQKAKTKRRLFTAVSYDGNG
jgi:hypothetical protein